MIFSFFCYSPYMLYYYQVFFVGFSHVSYRYSFLPSPFPIDHGSLKFIRYFVACCFDLCLNSHLISYRYLLLTATLTYASQKLAQDSVTEFLLQLSSNFACLQPLSLKVSLSLLIFCLCGDLYRAATTHVSMSDAIWGDDYFYEICGVRV